MPDLTGPRPMRLRLEDVLEPDEEISARALLLVLADEVLANAGTGPAADARTRRVAERLRTLTARGDATGEGRLKAAAADALGDEESELFNMTWGNSAEALALVTALTERLIPIIAAFEGAEAAAVAMEIQGRFEELAEVNRDEYRLPAGRWPLARWGPDPLGEDDEEPG